jgi:hypothetical protein
MKRKHSHQAKTKDEREFFVHSIRNTENNPTIPVKNICGESTLTGSSEPEINSDKPPRKMNFNRIVLHFKENCVSYLISLTVAVGVYFLVTSRVELAQVNKDLSYQSIEISKTAEKVDKIHDEVFSLKSEVRSLNDRFQLIIDLFSQTRTEK